MFRACFIDIGDLERPFCFATQTAGEAKMVLDAIERFDLHIRPEPSDHSTTGWIERLDGEEWLELDDDELAELESSNVS